MTRTLLFSAAVLAAVSLVPTAWAEPDAPDTDPIHQVESPDDDGAGHRFESRPRLTRTILADDVRDLAQTRDALLDAEQALADAIDAEAPDEVIDRLQRQVASRRADLDEAKSDFDEERDQTRQAVEELSDDQVVAFNRSLNDTVSRRLPVDIDSEDIQRAVDESFDRHQIQFFTKSFEEKAKFQQKADRFHDRYDATGKEQFRTNAERARQQGHSQQQKFLAKVDGAERVEHQHGDLANAAQLAKHVARREARDTARAVARSAARDTARHSARRAGAADARGDDDRSHREARRVARAEARESAKNEGRGKGKGKKGD